jgi:ABC-2 type transport system ATP-binding protein
MSIIVSEVIKKYGKQTALDKVDFTINTGEIVGFLGPNGAGKSTMMKIICGYLPSTSGKVHLSGIDVAEDTLNAQAKIGYLPEHNPLYLDMYVKEFLDFIGGIHKVENVSKRIEEVIDLVGLTKEQNKKISQLSKGYRQRVGLAQALFHDPEVLILDEPTTGLDPNQIIEIRSLIKSIGKNKTVMLSTHIMQEVEAICDRAIIINEGVVVADDSVENLQKLFGEENLYVFEFDKPIKEMNLEASLFSNYKKLDEFVLEISGDTDLPKKMTQFALKQDATIQNIEKKSATLESVFQHLTKKKH